MMRTREGSRSLVLWVACFVAGCFSEGNTLKITKQRLARVEADRELLTSQLDEAYLTISKLERQVAQLQMASGRGAFERPAPDPPKADGFVAKGR